MNINIGYAEAYPSLIPCTCEIYIDICDCIGGRQDGPTGFLQHDTVPL